MEQQKKDRRNSLLIGLIAIVEVVVIVAIVGVFVYRPEPEIIAGEAEASEYRVSGKVPGRIEEFYFEEGDMVRKGDTLVSIYSPEVQAKMDQAQAARAAAEAIHQKALNGARKEQIEGAYELYQKAKTGREIYEKSFERVQRLYEKGVITLQKRDETEAQYKAALATEKAALSQYNMAKKGAQEEDKEAAKAMVERVNGIIEEVKIAQGEKYLVSPIDGMVSGIFPKRGELVGQGSPVMSILDINDIWFVFSIREDLLEGYGIGSEWYVQVPALGKRTYKVRITHIKAMASYATWRATKSNDRYDTRTFEVKARPLEPIDGLHPGMTAVITERPTEYDHYNNSRSYKK